MAGGALVAEAPANQQPQYWFNTYIVPNYCPSKLLLFLDEP